MAEVQLDRIYIRDLKLRCILGIYDEERREKQDVVINITMWGNFSRACESDNLDDTVDYKMVKKKILALVENSDFFLVERLAQAIADICLAPEAIVQAQVTVDKPGALRFAQSVALEITRTKPHGTTQ
jgi:dihydroneopterin aldolase/D-erythro-7,8-dihydroneopterin triphosphate epimerase